MKMVSWKPGKERSKVLFCSSHIGRQPGKQNNVVKRMVVVDDFWFCLHLPILDIRQWLIEWCMLLFYKLTGGEIKFLNVKTVQGGSVLVLFTSLWWRSVRPGCSQAEKKIIIFCSTLSDKLINNPKLHGEIICQTSQPKIPELSAVPEQFQAPTGFGWILPPERKIGLTNSNSTLKMSSIGNFSSGKTCACKDYNVSTLCTVSPKELYKGWKTKSHNYDMGLDKSCLVSNFIPKGFLAQIWFYCQQ